MSTNIEIDGWAFITENDKWVVKNIIEVYYQAKYVLSIEDNALVIENREMHPDNIDDGYTKIPFKVIQKLIELNNYTSKL